MTFEKVMEMLYLQVFPNFFEDPNNYKIAHFVPFLYAKMGYKKGYANSKWGTSKKSILRMPLDGKCVLAL